MCCTYCIQFHFRCICRTIAFYSLCSVCTHTEASNEWTCEQARFCIWKYVNSCESLCIHKMKGEKKLIIHFLRVYLMLFVFSSVLSLFCSLRILFAVFLFVHFASLFACSHSFYQFQCSSHPRPCTYRLTFFRCCCCCFGRFVCFDACVVPLLLVSFQQVYC